MSNSKSKKTKPKVDTMQKVVDAANAVELEQRKKVAKKKAKGKRGSKTNPFPQPDFRVSADDLEPGYYRTFVIEKYDESLKQWEPDEWHNTLAQAEKGLIKCERWEENAWVNNQQRDWTRQNTNNRQERSLNQVAITPKTTDEEIAAEAERMKATRDRLRENPPAKMPKFSRKDAPVSRYRIVERWIAVTTKTVTTTKGRKGKK